MSQSCLCNQKLVQSGENCTQTLINRFKTELIGKNKEDFIKDIEHINKYIENNDNKLSKYSLCSLPEGKTSQQAYENCAINNPWLTLDASKTCSLPKTIPLPNGFSYTTDGNKIIPPKKMYKYNVINSYCQERWYDWFTIPDYHLGNKYTIIPNKLNVFSIDKCMKPCKIGYIPSGDISDNDLKCVEKNYYKSGKYANTINYLPISLILLLGSTKDSLKEYYKFILNDIKVLIENNNLELDSQTYENLYSDDTTFDKIYTDINIDIKKNIEAFLKLPIDINNILVPDYNTFEASKSIIYKSRIEKAYEICKNLYNMTSDSNKSLEYLNWRKKLAETSDNDISTPLFKKRLALLKKACNVTFDGKSEYSKDYILYTLNKDISINEVGNLPIELDISLLDTQYNLTLNTDTPAASSTSPHHETDMCKINASSIECKKFYSHYDIKGINKDILLEYKYKYYINTFGIPIGIIFVIIFGILILNIISKIAGPSIAELFNTIILFLRNAFMPIIFRVIRTIKRIFQNKDINYTPDETDKYMANDDYSHAEKNVKKLKESIESDKIE